MESNETNVLLNIETNTWLKETEDLFDFETKEIKINNFNLINDDKISYIISFINDDNNEEIQIIKNSTFLQEKVYTYQNRVKILCEILYDKQNSTFDIINPYYSKNIKSFFKKENYERIWNNLPKTDLTEIKEGDIIKLGRIRLKFNKIVLNNDNNNNENFNDLNDLNNSIINNNNNHNISMNSITNLNNTSNDLSGLENHNNNNNIKLKNNKSLQNNNSIPKKIESKFCCRICYTNESGIDDPLITPCKCNGSMGYIHYKCLKSCIEAKVQKKSEECYETYFWKSYHCEICLFPYPKYIKYKNKKYYLIDIDTSNFSQYCICDYSIFDDSLKKTFPKGYIVIKIEDNKEITLGRNQTNGVKLKDISVSRKHCFIIKKDNKLFLNDLNSKFGTLKYIKNKKLEINNNFDILCGKHRIKFNLTTRWNFFNFNFFKLGCCSCKQTNDNEEFIVNFEKENKNFNSNLTNNNIKDKFHSNLMEIKYKDDDSYNDYILNIDKIGVEEDLSSNNLIINMNTTSYNNKLKDESMTNYNENN